jgi:hypothetical protein
MLSQGDSGSTTGTPRWRDHMRERRRRHAGVSLTARASGVCMRRDVHEPPMTGQQDLAVGGLGRVPPILVVPRSAPAGASTGDHPPEALHAGDTPAWPRQRRLAPHAPALLCHPSIRAGRGVARQPRTLRASEPQDFRTRPASGNETLRFSPAPEPVTHGSSFVGRSRRPPLQGRCPCFAVAGRGRRGDRGLAAWRRAQDGSSAPRQGSYVPLPGHPLAVRRTAPVWQDGFWGL